MRRRALGIAALGLASACAAPYAPQAFDFADAATGVPPFFGTVELRQDPQEGFLHCGLEITERSPAC